MKKEIWYTNQEELIQFFTKKLLKSGRDFHRIGGNLICIDKPETPCLVAHMDTVNDSAMSTPIIESGGFLYRKNTILGADDRAGCQIIHNHFNNCNFILTVDEESGGLGAEVVGDTPYIQQLVNDMKVPCLLEFDRRGNSDIVGIYNDYCDERLSDAIQAIAPDYTDATGTFTDIDRLKPLGLQGVNLSVGYYDQHTNREKLNLKEFARADKLAKDLLKGLTGDWFPRTVPSEWEPLDDFDDDIYF